MDVVGFNFSWFDNGDILCGYLYLIYRPLIGGYQDFGDTLNHGNDDISNYSSNNSSCICPSYFSGDNTMDCTPIGIYFPQVSGAALLSSLIPTHAIAMVGLGDTSGDDSYLGVKDISDTISGNEDFIFRASVQLKQNYNSMHV